MMVQGNPKPAAGEKPGFDAQIQAEKDGDSDEVETDCGYGSWKPACLQCCNNSKVALLVISLFSIVQGFVVNGIINANATSIERRFGFSSLELSIISGAYDFAGGLFVIPIGYYGRIGHKPRWLASACLIMGIGSCIMFLPHFITGLYDYSSDAGDLCMGNSTVCSSNADVVGGKYLHLAIFIIGQMLHGIGGTTLYTLGVIWLDDNVKQHQLSMYVGIMEGSSALGPAIGYILGGVFLDFYVDIDVVDTKTLKLKPSDPRWVGAWWIGLVVGAVLAISISILLYCFGWELPDASENRKGKISQAHNDGSEEITRRPGFGSTIRDLPRSTLLLLKNPTFMCMTVTGLLSLFLVMAYSAFMPKFIQNQFQQTASWSALLTGFVAIPSIAGGQLAGGLIPAKMKLKVRGMMIMSIISFAVCLLPMPVLFARCSPTTIAGVNAYYENSSISMPEGTWNLSASCNAHCGCSTYAREPLCGADGVQYFSGCYAGCMSYNYSGTGDSETKNFSDCSCVGATRQQTQTAVSGRCPTSCDLLIPFLLLMFVVCFALALPLTPLVTVTLRVVPENLRGYALAVQWVFIRFLGSMPGPVFFGWVLDSSCIIWQDKCGERGSCWTYDSFKMSWTTFVFSIATGITSLIFMVLALVVYKPPDTEVIIGATDTQTEEKGADNEGLGIREEDIKAIVDNTGEREEEDGVQGQNNPSFIATAL